MSEQEPKKIVYLFGAGATHAELSNIGADENGLLIGDVTRRVILKANGDTAFLPHNRMFLERAADSSNIELFISLIEDNASDIREASAAVDRLKELVEQDIKAILTAERLNTFYLHKALFELHEHNDNEIIIGLISLNYDTVLDTACKWRYGDGEPDYSFPFRTHESDKPPLLKLHGSFSWEDIEINGRKRKIPIIPVGINKNYLRLPYNFIWGRALEVLTDCDILRVVGCSLSPNDVQLIDLLFKAHLEKGAAFEIQIISSDRTGLIIKSRYDFFPKITTAEKIEEPLIRDVKDGSNMFKEWLKAKGSKVMQEAEIQETLYLKNLIL